MFERRCETSFAYPAHETKFLHRLHKHPCLTLNKIPRVRGGFYLKPSDLDPSLYLTASLSAFAARNFGTRIAAIWIVSPVRGFLP